MELTGFIALFVTTGAIGFRCSSLRGRLSSAGSATATGVDRSLRR